MKTRISNEKRRSMTRRRLPTVLVLGSLSLASLASARADSIKLSNAWIDDVQVQSIGEGVVIYTTKAGNEVNPKLETLQDLKLTAYPELTVASDAIAAGKDAEAIGPLAKVAAGARQKWAQHWARYQALGAFDRLGRAVEATDAFLALAKESAEPHYLAKPPLASIGKATPEQKKQVLQRFQAAGPALSKGPAAEAIKKMTELASAGLTPAPVPAVPGGNPGSPATPVAAPAAAAVPLPKAIAEDDPIGQMLRQGQFQPAADAAQKALAAPTERMAMQLYELGVAQLHLAEARGDEKLYEDAGLSFMRVVIHFPRSDSWVAPALVEAGVVHLKIGRPDIANRLWAKAAGMLTEDDEPAIFARLQGLMQGGGGQTPVSESGAAGKGG